MRWLLVLLATTLVQCQSILKAREPAASRKILDKSGYLYDPTDRSCDGYPRLEVETMPGTCLGLVLPAEKTGFRMPRTILQVRGTTDFLLVDMGGWATRKGALYLLHKGNNGYEPKLLKSGLDKPHGLAYGADDFIYVGETHQISRFRLRAGAIEGWQVAVGDLPRFEGHMHPLTQFTFDERNGDLFVNSGAPSDHCFAKEKGTYVDCPETSEMGLGAIYRYPAAFLKDLSRGPARMREMAGQGLRNSMAMTVSPAGYLIQAENSRDFPQLEEPYEEINVIDLKNSGHHHGWPQCYNFHAVSPEWLYKENSQTGLRKRFQTLLDCGGTAVTSESYYQMPHALIPPHAAPLHMAYYGKSGQLAPLLGGKLIMSWHGYQPAGQRLVAYPVDAEGRPVLTAAKNATYGFNQKGACAVRKPFAPTGGLERVAPYEEVISGWDEVKGKRPKGAPVGFTVADDGSIWIVEDRNTRTVTRLARAGRGLGSGSVHAAVDRRGRSAHRAPGLAPRDHRGQSGPRGLPGRAEHARDQVLRPVPCGLQRNRHRRRRVQPARLPGEERMDRRGRVGKEQALSGRGADGGFPADAAERFAAVRGHARGRVPRESRRRVDRPSAENGGGIFREDRDGFGAQAARQARHRRQRVRRRRSGRRHSRRPAR